MAIPANVIYFTGYDWLRFDERSPIYRYVNDRYAPFASGTMARIAAASVISPIEMFRTRLQATSGMRTDHFKATLRGLHQMTQTQGYSSLWRGLTLTMWRDVPFSGLYWWGYETVRNALTDMRERRWQSQGILISGGPQSADDHQQLHSRLAFQSHQNSTVTFIDSFFAGAVSGALAAFITTPFDVGKTRQQVFRHRADEPTAVPSSQSTTSSAARANTSSGFTSSSFAKFTPFPSASSPPPNVPDCLRPEELSIPRFLFHIFREEGLSGLFRGWAARCLKVAPACAIMISSYEVGKKMAGRVNERRGFAGNDP
jgi:solute carrier family 25 protein 39/40